MATPGSQANGAPRVGIVKYWYYGAFRLAPAAILYKYGVYVATKSNHVTYISYHSSEPNVLAAPIPWKFPRIRER